MDAVIAQVRFARLVRLEHAAKEAACAIQIKRLKESIKIKRDILRALSEKRVSADDEVRSKLVAFRESLEEGTGTMTHPEAISSDFDILDTFRGLTPTMLRVKPTPAPTPQNAGPRELPSAPVTPFEYKNGSSNMTPTPEHVRARRNRGSSITEEYTSDDASPTKKQDAVACTPALENGHSGNEPPQ